MAFAWNELDKKKKTMFVLSITAIALTLGAIIYQVFIRIVITSPIIDHRFPIWDSNPQVNYGFVLTKKTDGLNPELYPLYFPNTSTDPHDEIPEAYPATYCAQCKRPFAFITQIYEQGMKPDKCPICGNTDPETLIVLEKDEQILDFDLREYFDLYWDDKHLKFLDWTDENGEPRLDENGKSLKLFDYWNELQKKKGADQGDTEGETSETE